MSFLFKRNPKTPQELVRAVCESVVKLDSNSDSTKRYQDDCSRYLKQMKGILVGDDENMPQPDQISYLSQEVYVTDCLYLLIYHLKKLDFDARKDVQLIFSNLLRRQIANKSPTVDYLINSKPEIILLLLKGPESQSTGLICGQILRDCIKYDSIVKFILGNSLFWNLFKYVQIPIFELSTDSFITLHDLLTTHKSVVIGFLTSNYDQFVLNVNKLIQSANYVTKRQSIRLLSELVTEKENKEFLTKYFDDPTNLKIIMLILNDKSKNLQIEGFHIFKFFIAKPKKSQKVLDILTKNKENFIAFFKTFDIESYQDPNAIEERNYILQTIQELPDIERIN
ncbi:uncharacterized protein RJT21DRAFT_117322 [Scheffersomyces amazonensis]|uniref:uncharacterized protein n=1 Tax=Scheffersomyces amazonensis TaxID=1078765 RepID=UPI00315C9FFE